MNICMLTQRLCRKYGDERGIAMIADAGFQSIDYSMFFSVDSGILASPDDEIRAHFSKVREIVEKNGLYVYQTHTPFPVIVDNPERNEVIFEAERKALLASGILGARHAVVHPTHYFKKPDGSFGQRFYNFDKEQNKAANMEFYSRLIPYLDEYGTRIAIENMWITDPVKKVICPTVCSDPYEIADYVDTLNGMCKNGKRFVACLDVGHTNLSCRDMSIREIVNVLGDRLEALHIHDTDGVHDNHTAPGFGNIDWEGFCLGLKDIGYQGDFVYEADNFFTSFDESLMYDATVLLYRIAKNLCDKYKL